jgi:hypothetical protein
MDVNCNLPALNEINYDKLKGKQTFSLPELKPESPRSLSKSVPNVRQIMLGLSLPNFKTNKEHNVSLGDTPRLCRGQQKYPVNISSFMQPLGQLRLKAYRKYCRFLSHVFIYRSDNGP